MFRVLRRGIRCAVVLLCAVMLAFPTGALAATSSKIQFTDVKQGDEKNHASDVQWLADQGISEGWKLSNGKREFRGMQSVARADMAAFLYRLAGSPKYTPSSYIKSKFVDVTEKTPHAKEIWWLAEKGISEGFQAKVPLASSQQYAKAIEYAKTKLGYPYFGYGDGTLEEWDCSTLIDWAFDKAGIQGGPSVQHWADSYYSMSWNAYNSGTWTKDISKLKPGDLVFWSVKQDITKSSDHVGLYIGNGKMIHANYGAGSTGKTPEERKGGVEIRDVATYSKRNFVGGGSLFKYATEFRPYATVARQDMAAFLHRFSQKVWNKNPAGSNKLAFTDVKKGDTTNHAADVEWLAANGVSTGWKNKSGKYEFRGLQPVARQDMAAFLHRLATNVKK